MTFVGLNILFISILYVVGERLYIKGLTKNSGKNKTKISYDLDDYKTDKRGTLFSFIKRERINVLRSPIYTLNTVVINLLVPIIMIATFLISNNGNLDLSKRLLIDFNNGGVLLIGITMIFFLSTMGGTSASSSAISREGKEAWFMKAIPVNLKKQVDAKVYFASIIDLVAALFVEIFIISMIKTPWYYLILVNVPFILLVLIKNYIGILLDLKNPKLVWNDEAEAVKQNLTVLVGTIISFAIIGIMSFVSVLCFVININVYLVFLVFTIVMVVCYILLALYIKKNQVKLFSKVG
jgi:ABC-2 type transport system permease protein